MTHEPESEASFRVTQRRIAARVALASGAHLTGEFACPARAHQQVGSENLADLLNDPAPFVPFFLADRPQPVLLGKPAIRLVEVLRADAAPIAAVGEDRPVALLLADGTEFAGALRVVAPRGRTRTLDVINGAGAFLWLRAETQVLLVNVAVIVLVTDTG